MKSAPKASAENQGQLADILSGAGSSQAIAMNADMGAATQANERDSRQRAETQGQDIAALVTELGAKDRDYKRGLDTNMANTISSLMAKKAPTLKLPYS